MSAWHMGDVVGKALRRQSLGKPDAILLRDNTIVDGEDERLNVPLVSHHDTSISVEGLNPLIWKG
jgi:hypothetical protein